VLADAAAIDAKYYQGEDIGPLCGLGFAVKDNIDVAGYPTVAGTPALEGRPSISLSDTDCIGRRMSGSLSWGALFAICRRLYLRAARYTAALLHNGN
jgi:hypothetical protein